MVPHERQGKARWSQSFVIACYILVTDVNEIKWGSRFSSKFDINVLYYRVGVKINRVLRTPHLNANWSFYPWYISACRVCGFSSCASSLGHMTSVCLLYLLCEELNFFKPLEVSLLQHDSLSVWDDGASWSILYRRGVSFEPLLWLTVDHVTLSESVSLAGMELKCFGATHQNCRSRWTRLRTSVFLCSWCHAL